MAVLGGARAALGAHGYRAFCRERVQISLSNPLLFAAPAKAAAQLFGKSPWALLRSTPVGMGYIFKDAGTLSVEVAAGERSARVAYRGFPPQFSVNDVWSLIWLGTLDAIVPYAFDGAEVDARETRREPEHGLFEWTATLR